jgi:hypothetical protein
MAKIRFEIANLSGTVGENVFVDSKTYPRHTRRRQRAGLRKDEPAVKENYSRTAILNNLAAGINNALDLESDHHKDKGFYVEVQKRFRQQTLDNRYVLLASLRGMDLHPRYRLAELGSREEVIVKPEPDSFKVTVSVKIHPYKWERTNCYCYKVMLLTWNTEGALPKHEGRYSTWRYLDKPTPEFEFSFPRDADVVHWLVCVKLQMGFNDEPVLWKYEGARIVEVGTFKEEDEVLLNGIMVQQELKSYNASVKPDPIMRVKAKDEE